MLEHAGEPLQGRTEASIGRIGVLAILLAAHALFLYSLASFKQWRAQSASAETPDMVLFYFEPLPQHSAPAVGSAHARAREPIVNSITLPQERLPEDADIDWSGEAEAVARDQLRRESASSSFKPLDAHPQGIGPLPKKPNTPSRGDVLHLGAGETIEWINERCYYSNKAPPGARDDDPLRLQLAICKTGGSAPAFQSFEDWKKSRD